MAGYSGNRSGTMGGADTSCNFLWRPVGSAAGSRRVKRNPDDIMPIETDKAAIVNLLGDVRKAHQEGVRSCQLLHWH